MPQEQWQIEWKDYYAILQVQPTAEAVVIKTMARALAQRYHPDKPGGDTKRMARINEAGEYLGDEQKKAVYDIEWHKRQGKSEPRREQLLPPRPTVSPATVTLKRTDDSDTYTAQFTVRNSGGPYETVEIVTPGHLLHPTREVTSWLGSARIAFEGRADTLPAVVSCPVTARGLDPLLDHKATVFVVLTDAEREAQAEGVDIVVMHVPGATRACYRCGTSNPASFSQCWTCHEAVEASQAARAFRDKFCKRCGRPFRRKEKWCPKDRYQRR